MIIELYDLLNGHTLSSVFRSACNIIYRLVDIACLYSYVRSLASPETNYVIPAVWPMTLMRASRRRMSSDYCLHRGHLKADGSYIIQSCRAHLSGWPAAPPDVVAASLRGSVRRRIRARLPAPGRRDSAPAQAAARGSATDGPGRTPLGLRARALRPTPRRDAMRRLCRSEDAPPPGAPAARNRDGRPRSLPSARSRKKATSCASCLHGCHRQL